MKPFFNPELTRLLTRATRIVQKGRLGEATAALQQMLRQGMAHGSSFAHEPTSRQDPGRQAEPAATRSDGAGAGAFTHHTTASGQRHYKLFVPQGFEGQQLPLIVMLHGCTQDPDDFAKGTRMNELAQAQGVIVLYPAQPKRSNASKCWNWFQPGDQRRGQGEPLTLADMTRHVVATQPVDARRVYVAGLSAGGAMAAILGREYPDLFAATGVHSGLPCGAAHDVPSAFAAMQGRPVSPRARPVVTSGMMAPTIVFHGDSDKTVHPDNGVKVLADAVPASSRPQVTRDSAAGRGFTRSVHVDANGRPIAEHWLVQGAGHAWSGGSTQGSYADSQGPDASREMLRFFLHHQLG